MLRNLLHRLRPLLLQHLLRLKRHLLKRRKRRLHRRPGFIGIYTVLFAQSVLESP
jgi:hypothetical protein